MPAAIQSPSRRVRIDTRPLLWGVSLVWVGILIPSLIAQWREVISELPSLLPWTVLLLTVNLLPVHGWKADLVPDWPIQLAAILVLTPLEAGLIGFVGAFDRAEFRRDITLSKAVFNRSQIGLVNFIVSLLVHALAVSPESSSLLVPLSFLALFVRVALNYLFAGTIISLEHGEPLHEVVKRLRLGRLSDFLLTLSGWAVLGALLAVVYDRLHPAALLAVLVPTLVGRQVLARSQMFIDAERAQRASDETVRQMSRQVLQERLDERRMIAADLHDEVLQPLFKITLMAHVVKADLESGRLLQVEEDLADLVKTAEEGAETVRQVIGELRYSSVRRGGLASALSTLVAGLRDQVAAHFHTNLSPVEADETNELVLYQIAKEAATNAVLHSKASNIWVELGDDEGLIRLMVRDDGVGFNPVVDRAGHFGLEIMRERARVAGGQLFVDSDSNSGTTVTVLLPRGHDPTDGSNRKSWPDSGTPSTR